MPAKYHIKIHPEPPRHKPIGKYCIIDWREDCSSCHNCVKRECAYSIYNDERDRLQHVAEDYVEYLYECKGCLCCVQSCTKGLLTQQVNPEYLAMGDDVWTADIISSTWFQAETGRIPVSGAGYPGPFRGPGFDSILTDMSEIVRPTRDGIHGREYISTHVDIGRKPMKLEFNADGTLKTDFPTQVEIPLPVIFNMMPWHSPSANISQAILDAANQLGTFAITDDPMLTANDAAMPHISRDAKGDPAISRLAQWDDCPDVIDKIKAAKASNPSLVAIVRLPLESIDRAIELAKAGVDGLHACADWRGIVGSAGAAPSQAACVGVDLQSGPKGKHISIAVREMHQALIAQGIRDQVTLIASGGISLAEHVIKTLLCGADAICIDVPLMIALECRVCKNCTKGIKCPIGLADVDHDYAVHRIVNLMGAWHSQMLEMMGAMGIREARRLRGEAGRAMFFDDLERDCFAPVFGKRVEVK